MSPIRARSGGSSSGLTGGDRNFRRGGDAWRSIRAAIQKHVVYPWQAAERGWEGRVVVRFRIEADGRVRDLRLLRSSGYPALDESALGAVVRAEPFPRPEQALDVVTPIEFRLR